MSAPRLLRAHVRGLEIDAQRGEGGVVNLVVRANQQQEGLIGRLRQHMAPDPEDDAPTPAVPQPGDHHV